MHKLGHSDVVLGAQYGDEGKARVVDGLAENYNIIARFNGGANAGHTIVNDGVKIALQQVPSGVFHDQVEMYIGSGCVVNLGKLVQEIAKLKEVGLDIASRLHISSQAGLVQAHHIELDKLLGKTVGTTFNGIGPSYADRAQRMWGNRLLNIRLCDLLEDPDGTIEKMRMNLVEVGKIFGFEVSPINPEQIKNDLEIIAPLVANDTLYLQKRVNKGENVLFEGAQAFMLDVNKGTVPYVTSSGTTAAAAYTGGDLAPHCHGRTIGVAKAVMSRVGHGPFASEFGGKRSEAYCMAFDDEGRPLNGRQNEANYNVEGLLRSNDAFEVGQAMRLLSGEYGTVTGRPRRTGMLDLVQLNYAVQTNGITDLIITKCDVLKAYSDTRNAMIPVVTAYLLDGEPIDYVPGSSEAYSRVEPVIEYRRSFSDDISNVKEKNSLPSALLDLLHEIEERVGTKVFGIGVGPERNQFVNL